MARLIEIARFTPDVAATVAFYERVLGRTADRTYDGMAEFDLGGVVLRIHRTYEPGEVGLPAEDHIAFGVSDVAAASKNLEGAGTEIERPRAEYPWGQSAYLRDPDGRLVELHEE